jgi:hypothetical protein
MQTFLLIASGAGALATAFTFFWYRWKLANADAANGRLSKDVELLRRDKQGLEAAMQLSIANELSLAEKLRNQDVRHDLEIGVLHEKLEHQRLLLLKNNDPAVVAERLGMLFPTKT